MGVITNPIPTEMLGPERLEDESEPTYRHLKKARVLKGAQEDDPDAEVTPVISDAPDGDVSS
jgi:hypothetical protein